MSAAILKVLAVTWFADSAYALAPKYQELVKGHQFQCIIQGTINKLMSLKLKKHVLL